MAIKFDPILGQLREKDVSAGGSATWGNIIGTITDQTDLSTALSAKADSTSLTSHTGNTSNPHQVSLEQARTKDGRLTGQVNLANDTSLYFEANAGNGNSFKTGSDNNFLFDVGGDNSVKIKGGDSAGVEGLSYTNASWSDKWRVNTNGDTVQSGAISASNVSGSNTGDQDLTGLLPLTGGTMSGALVVSPTGNPTLSQSIAPTVSTSSANARGLKVAPIFTSDGAGPGGIEAAPIFRPSTTLAVAYGLINIAKGDPDTGVTITNLDAGAYRADSGSLGGVITNAQAMVALTPSLGSLVPSSLRGVLIQNQTPGTGKSTTNVIGLDINSQSRGTTINDGIRISYPLAGTGVGNTGDSNCLNLPTASITLGDTTGTTTHQHGIKIGIPTYTSTTNARTLTNSAALYIAGAPVASTNVTITNGPYALWVDAGDTRLDGALAVGGAITGSNLSGTNSGDNAINSLYSGLATSKEDTGVAAAAVSTHAALTTGVHGAGANSLVYSNDSKLTDARTPLAHNQAESTITFTDVTTGNASATAHGFLPKWPNNTTTYLRGDGTYAAVAATGDGLGTDGDKGDITVGGTGTTLTIDAGAVTEAKMTLADNLTGNVSTTAHGFAPKAVAPAAGSLNALAIANGETIFDNHAILATTVPTTQAFGDSAAAGTALEAAHVDHKHAMMAAPTSVSGSAGSFTGALAGDVTGTQGATVLADTTKNTIREIEYIGTAGGTADVITLTPVPAIDTYALSIGQRFLFVASGNNTVSPPTINISAKGALNTTMGSVAVPVGGLISGNLYWALIESATSIRISPYDAVSSNGDTINGVLTVANITMNAGTLTTDTTTGLKIGGATNQKLGFYGATPIVKNATAYTQTYSTADKTLAAQTAAALTNNTGGAVSTTLAAITAGTTYAQADLTAIKNGLASLADQVNKLRNDHLDTAQTVNALIDDCQALGLVG